MYTNKEHILTMACKNSASRPTHAFIRLGYKF